MQLNLRTWIPVFLSFKELMRLARWDPVSSRDLSPSRARAFALGAVDSNGDLPTACSAPLHPATFLPPSLPASDCVSHKKKEAKQLPIRLWSFPKHCSSCISLVSVWACGWSLSYIHTLGSGLFGTQIGRSQTLHTPSVRGERSWARLYFGLQDTWKRCYCLQKHFSFPFSTEVIC